MSRAGLTAASILFTVYISATEVSAAGCYVKSSSECDCKIAEIDCGASVTTDKWTERCLCPATDKTYGKDIYYDKVNEHGLLSQCTHEYCLDRKTSRGSCYYMGTDTQIKPYIGHAVFCDVSEEECCGYLGCSAESYTVKMSNGGYFWYAAGYISGGKCCHCMASCDRSLEDATAATDGVCAYYDVTTSDCQRNGTHDSADTDGDVKMFGRHTCQVPTNIKASDMYVRYPPPDLAVPPPPDLAVPPPPETSSASGVQTNVAYLCQSYQDWNPEQSFEDPDSPGTNQTCKVYAKWITGAGGGPTDVGPSWTCVGATQVQQYHVDTVAKFGCCGPNGKSSCWNESNHASTPLSVFLLLTLTALNFLL